MTYFLRRLPLSRLLLVCGLAVVLGVSATALALALDTGPKPPAASLPDALHGALAAPPVEGVSARVQLTDRLLEGANLATDHPGSASGGGPAGQLSSSPLLSGASGRLWIAKDGRARLELQAEKGDTQIYYDGHTVSLYDASSNTLYRYTPKLKEDVSTTNTKEGVLETSVDEPVAHHEPPSAAKIEEAISHLQHVDVSGATPTDVAGQPAYTVRITPKESGSLIAGAELSWDAVHGVPLRAAIYSTTSSAPAVELAATEVSYGPVDSSVFDFKPPANAKVQEVAPPEGGTAKSAPSGEHPTVTAHGHGIASVAVIAGKAKTGAGESSSALPEGLQKVKINGVEASELPTELGTLLSFERSGVRYLLFGAVGPAALEAVAKGL
jgi:outer membrane lipoprotein-sorting protein